jgi:hypothetical protein
MQVIGIDLKDIMNFMLKELHPRGWECKVTWL